MKTNLRITKQKDLKEVKLAYFNFWKSEYKVEAASSKDSGVAMYTDSKKKPWKKFNGTCNHCGIQGHKKTDCRKLKKEQAEGKTGDGSGTTKISSKYTSINDKKKCYKCQKIGHIARDCPAKKSDGESFFVGCVVISDDGHSDTVSNEPETAVTNSDVISDDGHSDTVSNESETAVTNSDVISENDSHSDTTSDESQAAFADSDTISEGGIHRDATSVITDNESGLEIFDIRDAFEQTKMDHPITAYCESDWPTAHTKTKSIYATCKRCECEYCPHLVKYDYCDWCEHRDKVHKKYGLKTMLLQWEVPPKVVKAMMLYDWVQDEWMPVIALSDELNLQVFVKKISKKERYQLLIAEVRGIQAKKTASCNTNEIDDNSDSDGDDWYNSPESNSFFDHFEKVEETATQGAEWLANGEADSDCRVPANDDFVMTTKTEHDQSVEADKWLIDSGATVHVTADADRLYQAQETTSTVTVGNGSQLQAKQKGKLDLKQTDSNTKIRLHEVLHVPGFAKNVVSLSRLIKDTGVTAEFSHDTLTLTNSNNSKMEIRKEEDDSMFYLRATRCESNATVYNTTIDPRTASMDINEAHRKMSHVGETILRLTFKHVFEMKLTGELRPCDGCMKAKARAKNVKKVSTTEATQPGERLYLDTTGPFKPTLGGNLYDVKLVDQFSRKSWGAHVKKKSEVPKLVEKQFELFKGQGLTVKFLRCDNAGEHQKKLQEVCAKFGVQLEYTSPNTPQQNGVVERRITVDRERAHAMLAGARIREDAKTLLRAEAESTAETLANLACTQRSKDKSPNQLFNGRKSKLQAGHLVEFGRIGYVTLRTKIKKKWVDKSFKGIMVGYAMDHTPDTYRIYNPETGAVIMTRDVKWADWVETDPTESMQLFETLKLTEVSKVGIDEDSDESDHDEQDTPHVIPDDGDEETTDHELGRKDESDASTAATKTTKSALRSSDIDREKRAKSVTWNMETRSASRARLVAGRDGSLGTALPKEQRAPAAMIEDDTVNVNMVFTAELSSDPGEPKTWQAAFQGEHAEVWMESGASEVMNFIKRKAWKKVPMKTVLDAGRKPIPTKVVLKTKFEHDGSIRNKMRIVTKGFHMIPGVDYTESFSPVAMATSNRTAVVISLFFMNGGSAELTLIPNRGVWVMEMFDVEAAFLNAKYEGKKKMYIAIPEMMEVLGFVTEEDRRDYAIELMVSMYGNVDSALMFFRTYSATLLKMGMTQSRIDPCVFFKSDDAGRLILLLCCHIDDTTISGYQDDVLKFLDEFETHLAIERLGRMKKHLGVWYEWKRDDEGIYVVASMNKMVNEIDEAFQEATGKRAKFAKTPGFPGKMLSKNVGAIVNLKAYRSLVGKLLYYMTKVAPEMANAVRDLSSHMSNPGEDHWKSLERCVGYLVHLSVEKRGLVFRKPKELQSISYADGDYAKCEDTRRSISGNLNTIGGTLTNFCSKKQDTVALSTAESELNSYSLCCQEALFQNALLEELLNFKPKPAIIMEDNMGCIFMIKNQRVGQRTKHIDTRASFTRQHYQQRRVMPIFTRTELMYADGMTKNLPETLFAEHAHVIRNGNLPCRREDVELDDTSDTDDVSHESQGNE